MVAVQVGQHLADIPGRCLAFHRQKRTQSAEGHTRTCDPRIATQEWRKGVDLSAIPLMTFCPVG